MEKEPAGKWREIERKFLVAGAFKPEAGEPVRMVQGYLSSVPERSVRVRICGERAFLTVKGKPEQDGIGRFEWEKELSVPEASALLALCEPGIIEKVRYPVDVNGFVYEVDEFLGENQGLVVAELELESETAVFEKPAWLGKEVTGDPRYYNASLTHTPFKKWNK
ncbi:MAG: CYTH domain-containing protein [Culturomica sp.]|jgi:CYTH domain-containing protein|nr:CYTH domain-containing protein [Culturomica sp.]